MIDAAELPVNESSTIIFLGRILPDQSRITVPPKSVQWTLNDTGWAQFRFGIDRSAVVVECAVVGNFLLGDVYRRALDLAQAMADVICFANGLCLTVVFERIIHDGKEAPLAVGSPGMCAFCSSFSLQHNFDEVLQLVIAAPALAVALNDLNVALAHHHLSPVNYARAIEAIRVMIAGPDEPVGSAWDIMRRTLRVDRPYLQLITDTSMQKRHGNHERIEGVVVEQISERAWRVMDRFLAYRLGGNKALDESAHTLLCG